MNQLYCVGAVMNQFILKLDNRYEKTKKPGAGSTVKRERVAGEASTTSPLSSLPLWMIDANYKTSTISDITTVCIRGSSLDHTQDVSMITGTVAILYRLFSI